MSASVSSRVAPASVLDPDEAAEWARRLRRTARPCGCKSGAAASLFVLVAWPAWIVESGRWPDSIVGALAALLVYAFAVIGAGVAGKVAGIVVVRHRHRRLQRAFSARVAAVGS